MLISFNINGQHVKKEVDGAKTLLNFLRDDMGLTGVKKGCEVGECGACTVLLNKKAVNSCMILVGQVDGSEIITIEGVSKDVLNPLQEKLLKGGAVQCGYCTPGMIMAILGLLYENPKPNAEDIKRAIDGNLCRCTGYGQIIESVEDIEFDDLSIK